MIIGFYVIGLGLNGLLVGFRSLFVRIKLVIRESSVIERRSIFGV